jgi:hypothetical protein
MYFTILVSVLGSVFGSSNSVFGSIITSSIISVFGSVLFWISFSVIFIFGSVLLHNFSIWSVSNLLIQLLLAI